MRDLTVLGLDGSTIESLPRCLHAPQISCFAEALGCAYVLEGATLGGQVITRHLRRELNVDYQQGAAFFASYGKEAGPMWQEFISFLNGYELTAREEIALIESACDTFMSFDEWLRDIL